MPTLLLAVSVHPKIVQEQFGHSSIDLTLDRYSHVAISLQHDAAAVLDALPGGWARANRGREAG